MLRALLLAGLLVGLAGVATAPAQAGSAGACVAGVCAGVGLPTGVGTCVKVSSPALLTFPDGYVVAIACA